MIPKKIHYVWVGHNPKSPIIEECIATWKKKLPDYQIIEWNEDNFDMHENRYIEQAYAAKKWAFVSDYVRARCLKGRSKYFNEISSTKFCNSFSFMDKILFQK
jgi:mannosyltransferase OCH1-like enzyme